MSSASAPWLRPLLALDSAEGADAAWSVARARTGGSCALAVLHATGTPLPLMWCGGAPGCPTVALPEVDLDLLAADVLRRFAHGLPASMSVTTLACSGRRAPSIAEWARRLCADGVVVACGGDRLVRRLRRELDVEVIAA